LCAGDARIQHIDILDTHRIAGPHYGGDIVRVKYVLQHNHQIFLPFIQHRSYSQFSFRGHNKPNYVFLYGMHTQPWFLNRPGTSAHEESRTDILTEEAYDFPFSLIVWNDEVNTFEWVIETLIEVCGHSQEQAEQCAMLIHTKGKYAVKHGLTMTSNRSAMPSPNAESALPSKLPPDHSHVAVHSK
jgi:ATP-dependent Clp protease adaptor protein ClpS